MSIKLKELPVMERPYEKLELYGPEKLTSAELLAIIIKTGTKEETAVQLAQKILNLSNDTIDGINFLRNISIEDLMQIKGIGKVKAIQLKAVIKKPEDLAKILMEELRFEQKEILKIVILNNKNEILKIKDISVRRK